MMCGQQRQDRGRERWTGWAGWVGRWSGIARRVRVPLGFLFAAFFLWLAQPSPQSLAWSLVLVIPGLLLRAWASGHVRKNAALSIAGPYAYTRNPLYLGSLLIAFGFAAASRSILIVIVLAALFAVIYVPTIFSEERFLRSSFPGYEEYANEVPRFFPWRGRRGSRSGPAQFSAGLYSRHREYNALLGTCAIYVILIARMVFRF